MCVIEDYVSAE